MYILQKSGAMLRGMNTNNNSSSFGKRLQNARKKAGLTQPDVLEELKERNFALTQGALSHYETGRNYPDPDLMAAMAEIVGVSIDYLAGATKTPHPVAQIEEAWKAASGAGKINRLMDRLPKEKQKQVLDFAEYLLSQEKQRIKPVEEIDEWVSLTEVLMKRHGVEGEQSFMEFLTSLRPDLATRLGLGIPPKKKRIQD